jgi:preprotein translocase subunit SecE
MVVVRFSLAHGEDKPFQFIQQVRTEAAKVTWPTRRETAITTVMVFVMVALATVFFFVADQIMSWASASCSAPPAEHQIGT